MTGNAHGAMYRQIAPHQHHRVTYAELFFDLVFVFAVTQISHTLLAHFTPLGVLQVTLLFLAVWWVWVFTTWITNWLDPEQTPVRLLLFAMMLGGLVLSTSIPTAFEGRGLWFAIAYAAMQVGKTVFLWVSTPPSRMSARMNAIRITAWLSMSAVFWIAGGLAEGQSRLVLWAIALVIEYMSPAVRFWIPRYGAVLGRGLGDRRRPHGRALRALRHHCTRRIRHRYRCDVCRACLVGGKRDRIRLGARRKHRDVVDLLPQGRGSRLRGDFEIERAWKAGAARLYLSAHADHRRHHRFARWRTSSC